MRHPPPHNRLCVRAEFLQIIACKGRRRTHDVSTESDRMHSFESEEMRADDVVNIHSPVQKLVHLGIGVLIGLSDPLRVVRFRKET